MGQVMAVLLRSNVGTVAGVGSLWLPTEGS